MFPEQAQSGGLIDQCVERLLRDVGAKYGWREDTSAGSHCVSRYASESAPLSARVSSHMRATISSYSGAREPS